MTAFRALTLPTAVLVAAALAGCAAVGTNFAGKPNPERVAGEAVSSESGIEASWFYRGAEIAITVWGSSSCPVSGHWIHVVEPAGEGNTVSIDMNPVPDGPCTTDHVPHTTLFYTPGAITTAEPLRIQILGEELVLPVK